MEGFFGNQFIDNTGELYFGPTFVVEEHGMLSEDACNAISGALWYGGDDDELAECNVSSVCVGCISY